MRDKTTAALKLAEEALNAMLTHMGMDEDEWTKPTFNQAREALAAIREALAQPVKQEPVSVVMWPNDPDQIPEGQHYIRDDGSPMYLDGCEAQYSVCLRKTDYCLGYDTIAYCFDKRSAEMLARALNDASEEHGK